MPESAEALRAFMYACGSAIAMSAGTDEAVLLPPIARGPSPAAHRAAVDHQVAKLIPQLDRMLSAKVGRPVGTTLATLGRLAVSEGEKLDIANNSYQAGPRFWGLIAALKAEAANTNGAQR